MPSEKRHLFAILADLDDLFGEFGAEGAYGIFEADTGFEKARVLVLLRVSDVRIHFEEQLFEGDGKLQMRSLRNGFRPKEREPALRQVFRASSFSGFFLDLRQLDRNLDRMPEEFPFFIFHAPSITDKFIFSRASRFFCIMRSFVTVL